MTDFTDLTKKLNDATKDGIDKIQERRDNESCPECGAWHYQECYHVDPYRTVVVRDGVAQEPEEIKYHHVRCLQANCGRDYSFMTKAGRPYKDESN